MYTRIKFTFTLRTTFKVTDNAHYRNSNPYRNWRVSRRKVAESIVPDPFTAHFYALCANWITKDDHALRPVYTESQINTITPIVTLSISNTLTNAIFPKATITKITKEASGKLNHYEKEYFRSNESDTCCLIGHSFLTERGVWLITIFCNCDIFGIGAVRSSHK